MQQHHEVGVVVERRKLDSPWADHAWTPIAVLPEPRRSRPGAGLPATRNASSSISARPC